MPMGGCYTNKVCNLLIQKLKACSISSTQIIVFSPYFGTFHVNTCRNDSHPYILHRGWQWALCWRQITFVILKTHFEERHYWAGKMAQWLRTFAAFPETMRVSLSTQARWLTTAWNPSSGNLMPSSLLHGYLHMWHSRTQTYMQK